MKTTTKLLAERRRGAARLAAFSQAVRRTAGILAMALVFGMTFAACGGGNDDPGNDPGSDPNNPGGELGPEIPASELEYRELSSGAIEIIRYIGKGGGNLIIPSQIGGKPVTSIYGFSRDENPLVTGVIIPSSVTKIGQEAFGGLTNLESITIPFVGSDLVVNDDSRAHFGYIFGAAYAAGQNNSIPASLKTVIITGGNRIAAGAFRECPNLTSITIPDGVTSIGNGAFVRCTGLTSVTIPDSVTDIKDIGDDVFYGCTGLTSVTIPAGITGVPNGMLQGCTSLTDISSILAGRTGIGNDAFVNCTGLTSVTIPASVAGIDNRTFQGCTSLASVTFQRADTTFVTTNGFQSFPNVASLRTAYTAGGIGEYTRDNSTVPIPDDVPWVKQ